MNAAIATILGPLAAAALILVGRRWSGPIAVLGAAVGLAGGGVTAAAVAAGARPAATMPGLPGLPLRLVVDPLGALLATVVASVGLVVLVYATGYMVAERDQPRFFAAMSLFVAAMQTLVLAGDWLLFLAAWELIGLASYLLIGFWFERPGVGAAASRAFATTRAADTGLYTGIFALVTAAGTTEIAATQHLSGAVAAVAGIAFLLAAMGKSAQIPLQGWLLDAMAGPTPVSALLHSATLVVAGVVLLIRADPLLSPEVRLAIGIAGGATAVVTGLMAVAQGDVKRLLAASTSSQLGLMLLALGAGSVPAAVIHLVANAATKSALFLGAGIFQHARGSTAFADLAGVGRGYRRVFAAVATAGLALAGIPPLAGFWSKDAIIAATLHAPTAWLFTPLALAGTLLTGVYVARMLRLLWGTAADARSEDHPLGTTGAAVTMDAALVILVLLAATLGLAFPIIGRLLGVDIPEAASAVTLGLGAAGVGLAAGALLPAERLLGSLVAPARRGFRVDGGVDRLVVGPATALGRALDRTDRSLHRGVLAVGEGAVVVARSSRAVDAGVQAVVAGTGQVALDLAAAAHLVDAAGIDRLIADLVTSTRRLGEHARRLQTGLVHRELLVAAAGTAIVVVLLLLL